MIDPRCVWPVEAALGEGPIWLEDSQTLMFVDIKQGRIHRYVPATGERGTVEVGGQPSFIVPTDKAQLLVGSNDGLHLLEEDRLTPVSIVAMPAYNRTNDATVDEAGRLWFGTMDDEERRSSGALYCFDRGRLDRKGCDAVVTNGPALTADGRILYHVDSGERTIWRYPVDADGGLGSGEIFIRLSPDEGFPDGVVLDAEECLWVALWDGWSVRRYSPSGEILAQIRFPCARVTKIAFGGPDLRTAFATTARIGLDEAQKREQPLAGALFAFDAPVAGRIARRVALA